MRCDSATSQSRSRDGEEGGDLKVNGAVSVDVQNLEDVLEEALKVPVDVDELALVLLDELLEGDLASRVLGEEELVPLVQLVLGEQLVFAQSQRHVDDHVVRDIVFGLRRVLGAHPVRPSLLCLEGARAVFSSLPSFRPLLSSTAIK